MTRISSVSMVMETYYKLTQTPSEMEEELKKELSNQNKQQSGDTSALDDLTEVVGTIKDEIQFLNKAKNTFNEIFKIVDEAHNYLKNLNHEAITGLSQTNLKNKLDGYISSIRLAVSNDGGNNFSEELIRSINKLTEVNIEDIRLEMLSKSWKFNEKIEFISNSLSGSGIFEGISDNYEILIRTDTDQIKLNSGELKLIRK